MPPGVGDVPEISAALGHLRRPRARARLREGELRGRRAEVRALQRHGEPRRVPRLRHPRRARHPRGPRQAWAIRFLFCGPIAALLIAFVFKNTKPEWHQPAMLVFGLTVNTVVIWIGAISPPAGFFLYTVVRDGLRHRGAVPRADEHEDADRVHAPHAPPLQRVRPPARARRADGASSRSTSRLFTLGAVGALAARELDLQDRLAFVQRRIIREQMAALDAERSRSETLLLNVLPRRSPIA